MVLLLSTMWFGVMDMAYSLLVSAVISMIINSWPNRELLGYSFKEQIIDILPGILIALLMGIIIFPIQLLAFPDIIVLIIQIPLGAIIYIGFSIFFKVESFQYIWNLLRGILRKNKIDMR